VDRGAAVDGLRVVHKPFELEKEPPQKPVAATTPKTNVDAADVVRRLQQEDMEKLLIDDIALDESQARVTIAGVPDRPGIAAKIFQEVAGAGIVVDMIVQGHDRDAGCPSLSFTVPRSKLSDAVDVATRLSQEFSCKGVSNCPQIAKLSVSGVGLRSHIVSVFRALAAAGINVAMMNTSEVRVNVVVDGDEGQKGLQNLKTVFADALR
jgi:aspartate kinase